MLRKASYYKRSSLIWFVGDTLPDNEQEILSGKVVILCD